MIRRFGSGKLSSGNPTSEDVNPMSGVANMADAMLVLAVGIMLALVMNWNIDVGQNKVKEIDTENPEQIEELSEYDQISDEDLSDITTQQGLQEKGSVYMDPATGKMYIFISEDE